MITILTPTFNRAHTLERLFDSLNKQDFYDFEWVIVDDGSSDATGKLVDKFSLQSRFPVRYLYKDNGGKHSAINIGVANSSRPWVFIVDSDDFLPCNAVSSIVDSIKLIDDEFVGIGFRKSTFDGDIVGLPVGHFNEQLVLNPTEAGHVFQGELAYVFRHSTMNQCSFPIIDGEYFVPELYVWNKISDFGKIMYFPRKSIYSFEYLSDGYTKNFSSCLKRNPKGFAVYYIDQVIREANVVFKVKSLVRWAQCQFYIFLKWIDFII